jgi:hypothetical protein
MNAPPTPDQVSAVSTPIQIPELTVILLLAFFFALWGYRHGLDAVIIAGLIVLFGRASIDILARILSVVINIFYGLFELFRANKFSPTNLFSVLGSKGDVVQPLINIEDPNDTKLILVGTLLFALIVYAGFKFARQKAGGKDPFVEQVFGFLGGAALGYLIITYVISRHIIFPQAVEITASSDVKQIDLNGPLMVVVVLVIIVFGLQRTRPAAKK